MKYLLSDFIIYNTDIDIEWFIEACRESDSDISMVKYLFENFNIDINGTEPT